MEPSLTVGTKEYLVVLVKDKLGAITDLTQTNTTYDVFDEEGLEKITNGVPQIQTMQALCLIDTTGWAAGRYRLFLNIDAFPQDVILGPFKFDVEDPELV